MSDQVESLMLQLLAKSKKPLSSEEIGFYLDISEKTVLKYLKLLKHTLNDSGASLEIKQGAGSFIHVTNEASFNAFLKEYESSQSLNSPEYRKSYVLMRLLLQGDYINIYDLADELYVSPSLLRTILHSLQETLDTYHLELEHSRSHGYIIKGSEANIRNCLVKECSSFDCINHVLTTSKTEKFNSNSIQTIVFESLQQFNISIGMDGISEITLHIMLSLNRAETDNIIVIPDTEYYKSVRSSPEYYIAGIINSRMRSQLGVSLPPNELLYLAIHLCGKQRLYSHELLQVKVTQDALTFYNQFLRNIYKTSNESFFEDADLRNSLLNHIVPFLVRLRNNTLINHSDLLNTKNEYPYAYDLATNGLSFLKDTPLTTSEISYFALHLALALEKNKTQSKKHNIVVVCDTVSGLFHMITYKLNNNFEHQLGLMKFIGSVGLDTYKQENNEQGSFDLIINTTDKTIDTKIKTIKVTPFLSQQDLALITEAFKELDEYVDWSSWIKPDSYKIISANSKEDALQEIVKNLHNHYELPKNLLDLVMQRESLESTEYDNRVAIPHPINMQNLPDIIYVAKLTKPILWKEKYVQIIFFLCSSKSKEFVSPLMKKISNYIVDPSMAQALIQAETYEDFIQKFQEA